MRFHCMSNQNQIEFDTWSDDCAKAAKEAKATRESSNRNDIALS